jgi:hypothetical protein
MPKPANTIGALSVELAEEKSALGAVLERDCFVFAHQLGRGAGQHRRGFEQRDLLKIALVVTAGLQAGLAELSGNIRGGDVVTSRRRGPAFEQIAGQELDVTADDFRLYFAPRPTLGRMRRPGSDT